MADQPHLDTPAELLSAIRQGLVPRSVRLFAAQGLLPIGREDLIRVLLLLASEGDGEVAQQARSTLAGFSSEHFVALMEMPELESLDLELLVRNVAVPTVHEAVARHARVANETLRWLARHGAAPVQDVIMTNQQRLFSCLEILEELRENPNVTQDILRRVREFEEEFLEKAVVWATAGDEPELEQGPSVEEALEALRAIGMNLPVEGEVRQVVPPLVAEDVPPEARDLYFRVLMMNVFEKIMTALKGAREERLILVRDRNPLVVRAVMSSPKLTEFDVEQIANMRQAHDEALRIIGSKTRWLRRYMVVRNLAFNPKTPVNVAMHLLGRLSTRDLRFLARDRNVSAAVRKTAFARLERQR
jgi:hypothetical protein